MSLYSSNENVHSYLLCLTNLRGSDGKGRGGGESRECLLPAGRTAGSLHRLPSLLCPRGQQDNRTAGYHHS